MNSVGTASCGLAGLAKEGARAGLHRASVGSQPRLNPEPRLSHRQTPSRRLPSLPDLQPAGHGAGSTRRGQGQEHQTQLRAEVEQRIALISAIMVLPSDQAVNWQLAPALLNGL